LKRNFQRIMQIAFLALFIILFVKGKVQLWMGLFLFAIIASFLLGRVYCGWICPINTVMKGVTWIKKKLHIKNIEVSVSLTKPWVRFLTLGLFIAIFVFTMVSGKKLPVLPALFTIGIILTFFFSEELWHRYFCPYGTIMSFPASKARYAMYIDPNLCNNCGICKRVCPAKAVEKREHHNEILKGNCLICMECSVKCKQNAISYKGSQ
jgi:ferredoxin-type protein NapH